MAKKKENTEEQTPLVDAAKTIGEAAGKVVNAVEAVIPRKSSKIPKLAPKNKQRLPRREKKVRQKAHADTAQRKGMRRKQRNNEEATRL